MTESQKIRIVAGALKSCIDAHGPITKAWTGSAAKRVVKAIDAELTALQPVVAPDAGTRG